MTIFSGVQIFRIFIVDMSPFMRKYVLCHDANNKDADQLAYMLSLITSILLAHLSRRLIGELIV